MSQIEWREKWIGVIAKSGFSRSEAEHAFESLYRGQEIDTRIDPIEEAKKVSPMNLLFQVHEAEVSRHQN